MLGLDPSIHAPPPGSLLQARANCFGAWLVVSSTTMTVEDGCDSGRPPAASVDIGEDARAERYHLVEPDAGLVRGDDISWELGRQRGLGIGM
jgi:hypothetical protein